MKFWFYQMSLNRLNYTTAQDLESWHSQGYYKHSSEQTSHQTYCDNATVDVIPTSLTLTVK